MNKNETPLKHKEPQNIKVAIVLPIYNAKKSLPECLESLLSQTHKNFDIYAIDDSSTDNSIDILTKYQKKDNRIKVIKHKHNKGVSEARNTALQLIEASGTYDYISFCDSDDTISNKMISELLLAAIENHADVASCCFKQIPEESNKNKFELYCSFNAETFVEQVFSIGKWKNVYGSGGYVWLRLFDAEKIKGLRFKDDKIFSEDEYFCLEVATRVDKISYIPQQLYFYQNREQSLSRNKEYSRKLLLTRISTLSLSKNISSYASIINACAILRKARNNNDLFTKQLLNTITPLLFAGCNLQLIPKKKLLTFLIRTFRNRF